MAESVYLRLIHLSSLVIYALKVLGNPSKSIISELNPHLKMHPSKRSWLSTEFSGILSFITL